MDRLQEFPLFLGTAPPLLDRDPPSVAQDERRDIDGIAQAMFGDASRRGLDRKSVV